MNQDSFYNVVMAGCAGNVREMNARLFCVLERDSFGGGGSVMI